MQLQASASERSHGGRRGEGAPSSAIVRWFMMHLGNCVVFCFSDAKSLFRVLSAFSSGVDSAS